MNRDSFPRIQRPPSKKSYVFSTERDAPMTSLFATPEQIKPPNGDTNLDFFSQIRRMLVHRGYVLVTSSLIIFVSTFLLCVISNLIFR